MPTVGADTAMARWPLNVSVVDRTFPTVVVLDDDTAHTGTTDSLTPGRAVPHGTYNWFFPTGTVAVESARWNDQVRLQLSRATVAWVSEADVVRLPPGDRKSTRLNSSHLVISYAVFCLKKKKKTPTETYT